MSSETLSSITDSMPPDILESLHSYVMIPVGKTLHDLIPPALDQYIAEITTPCAPPSSTKHVASECEICERSWIPLTYHHLIPRSVHAKALKRRWHTEDKLNSVSWLCRACHSYVHSVGSNEELAREYFTVEKLLEREDVRSFAAWVGRVRWKTR